MPFPSVVATVVSVSQDYGFRSRSWQKSRVNVARHPRLYRAIFTFLVLAAAVCLGYVIFGVITGRLVGAARVLVPLIFWSWLAISYYALLRGDDPDPPRYYWWHPGV